MLKTLRTAEIVYFITEIVYFITEIANIIIRIAHFESASTLTHSVPCAV